MSKIFRVEEGNVLRLLMDDPDECPFYLNPDIHPVDYQNAVIRYNNRESYPYVAEGWKVGETKIQGIDFVIVRQDGIQVATLRSTVE